MIKVEKPVTFVRLGDLFSFLDENEALTVFFRNVENDSEPAKLSKLFEKDPTMWISGAFIWSSTPERHEFWEKLNKEWRKLLGVGTNEIVRVHDLLICDRKLNKAELC